MIGEALRAGLRFRLPGLATGAGVAVILVALATSPAGAALLPTGFDDDTLVTGLDNPNSMAYLPDGRILFTEVKTGRIRMIVGHSHVAATDPVATVDQLNPTTDERGLQGIAVDPRWPASPYVYVGYTHLGNRIWLLRYTAAGDLNDPAGENLTLGTPLILLNDLRDVFANHNGLGLRFDPAGLLYFSLGDDSDACSAQLPDTLRGKLLRLDVTRLPAGGGGPVARALLTPADNPFVASPDSNRRLVYAEGLRNPWRFHIDPVAGTIALADVGQNAWEEVDEVLPGANYGWPHREGPGAGPMVGCLPPPGAVFQEPIASIMHPAEESIAIHTAGFYRPVPGGIHNWPAEYHGDLFYGSYYHSGLRRLRKSGATWSVPPAAPGQPTANDFATLIYWSVDWAVGPDGSLYWLKAFDDSYNDSSGMLRRIRWTGPPASAETPQTRRALTAAPNPFRTRTEISFRLAAPARAGVSVYDAVGRHVRVLLAAGVRSESRVSWDGRDDRGRECPPGIYLVRLAGPDAGETMRVLKLR